MLREQSEAGVSAGTRGPEVMAPAGTHLPASGKHDLFRGMLSDHDAPLPLSAAGQQASRLAACEDGSFAFATGSSVFKLQCYPTRKRTRPDDQVDDPDSGAGLSNRKDVDSAVTTAVSSAIADDYIVPKPFSSLDVSRFVPHCTHQTEVQSVIADETRLASVDMHGRCVITTTKIEAAEGAGSSERDRDSDSDSFVLPPVSFSSGEPGWSGVGLKQRDPSVAVVARQFFRDISIFDRDVPVRTVHSILTPAAVGFCGEGNMVAVAEGPGLSFYDFRTGERGSCIGRKTAGTGHLLSLDVSGDGSAVATAGMDRTLHVFDTRTMTVRERWPSCLKYECAATVLSREMEGMVYVCSVDNEVACGAWSASMADYLKTNATGSDSLMISGANTKSPRRAFGFRGDVRLTGMARRNFDGEEIAVMSEAGAFYLLRRRRD